MSISVVSILVVEDIATVRELIEVQLKLRGYTVVTARDGQEALEIVGTVKPAVVITDILMPRVDGFALAHKLRADPLTAVIPIIFLSGTYVSAESARSQQKLESAPLEQRETYRRLLTESQEQYGEIQRELAVLNKVMQELEP